MSISIILRVVADNRFLSSGAADAHLFGRHQARRADASRTPSPA